MTGNYPSERDLDTADQLKAYILEIFAKKSCHITQMGA